MNHLNNAEHAVVVELLPWYVKGTLNPEDHVRVNQHLSNCPECQQEIVLYRQLNSADLTISRTPTWKPTPAQFSNILQSIDALESKIGTTAVQSNTPGRNPKLSALFKATPSPVFWFMSLETIALAALVLLVVARLPQQQPGEQLFKTLSNEHPAVSETLPRLSIVFAENITEREIRALLQAQHAQLVQGPSMLGVYTVELASDRANELQQAIANLRTNPKVKLVEGIDG